MFATFDIVEVADDAGSTWRTVAAVHFQLGERLELHWLRDRIVALPRDDRWRALARAALRDDLYGLHRALTAEVLARAKGDDVAERVEAGWRPTRRRANARDAGRDPPGQVFDTTTLPVAVREVRNLLQAG